MRSICGGGVHFSKVPDVIPICYWLIFLYLFNLPSSKGNRQAKSGMVARVIGSRGILEYPWGIFSRDFKYIYGRATRFVIYPNM